MSLTPYVHLDRGVLRDAQGGSMLDLPTEARTHLERVLRLQAGAPLVVADGEGREAAALLGVGTVVVDGPIVQQEASRPELHLVQALAKGRKTDEIVRSATELGVDSLLVVQSQRSVTKPDPNKAGRMAQRWRGIARSAAEQARRARLPRIEGPVPMADLLAGWPPQVAGVIGHPAAESTLRTGLASIEVPEDGALVAAVGPEGGWTEQELSDFSDRGLRPVRLGPSVLRTEHAGHALCAVLSFYLGRMG